MVRQFAGIVCLIAWTCAGIAGCASMGVGVDKSQPFRRGEQKEPEIDESEADPSDWRSEPSNLRGNKKQASKENWLDSLIWSSESRDIARSLHTDL